MKKEILITAVVFLGFGFLAGYIFKAQVNGSTAGATSGLAAASPASNPAVASAGSAAAGLNLPPGHPAVSDTAVIEMLEQQAANTPQDPGPPLKLADYLYDHGDFNQAVTWYQKALALDPNNVSASTDLGTCYFNLGRPDDALKQFHKSLAIEPRHQPTLYNIVVVEMEGKHDFKAAEQSWETLHRINPAYPKLDELKQRLDQARSSGER